MLSFTYIVENSINRLHRQSLASRSSRRHLFAVAPSFALASRRVRALFRTHRLELALILLRELIDQRRDHAARTAPRRPKSTNTGTLDSNTSLKRLVRHHRGERACEWIRDARRGWPCQSRRRRGCVRGRDRAMTRDDTRASRVITRASRLSRHHPRRGIHHPFARPTRPSARAIASVVASRPPPRAHPLARAKTPRRTRAREFLLHARARSTPRARRRVAPVRAFAHARRGPDPRGSTHPARIRIPARDGSTSNRHGHAPLVLVSARVTITARDLRRWCVRGATRARCVAFVVVVAPSVIARAAIVECGRARRKREGGGRAVEGLVRESCLVDRVVEGLVRES